MSGSSLGDCLHRVICGKIPPFPYLFTKERVIAAQDIEKPRDSPQRLFGLCCSALRAKR